jgi:hypothetical protein
MAGFLTGFSAGVESCCFGLIAGATGSRSPLVIRLTDTVGAALLAVTGLVRAVITPAMKQLKSKAAATFLNLTPYHMALLPSPAQKESALRIRRPTNTAVSDRPNTLVVTRSLVLTMATVPALPRLFLFVEDRLKRGWAIAPAYVGSRKV